MSSRKTDANILIKWPRSQHICRCEHKCNGRKPQTRMWKQIFSLELCVSSLWITKLGQTPHVEFYWSYLYARLWILLLGCWGTFGKTSSPFTENCKFRRFTTGNHIRQIQFQVLEFACFSFSRKFMTSLYTYIYECTTLLEKYPTLCSFANTRISMKRLLEHVYAYVNVFRLSITLVDGKQHLSEVVFSALVGFAL